MKLTNGTDTIVLTDKIQIRAYLTSGYTEVEETATENAENVEKNADDVVETVENPPQRLKSLSKGAVQKMWQNLSE